jgi:hypothetical protein
MVVAERPAQEIADFMTSNRNRKDGRYVMLLLCPDYEWDLFWRTVKNEVIRAPFPKVGPGNELFLMGNLREWHEFDAVQLRAADPTAEFKRTIRPLNKSWVADRVKERRFPESIPWDVKEDPVRLQGWKDNRMGNPVDFTFLLKKYVHQSPHLSPG